jgi:hypothetical protein
VQPLALRWIPLGPPSVECQWLHWGFGTRSKEMGQPCGPRFVKGSHVGASICSGVNTAVSIFTGPCDNLHCVTGKSFTCSSSSPAEVVPSSTRLRYHQQLQSTNTTLGLSDALSWLADEGKTYYLFVLVPEVLVRRYIPRRLDSTPNISVLLLRAMGSVQGGSCLP